MKPPPLKVMVVDDSAFMRKFIAGIISADPGLELVGTARDGWDALKKLPLLKPDVLTLDVEMPRLDGLEALKKLMKRSPLPVVMVSNLTRQGSEVTIEALSCGAVDFICKPAIYKGEDPTEFTRVLPEKIKAAAAACLGPLPASPPPKVCFPPSVPVPRLKGLPGRLPRRVVAIGSSTGGPRALDAVFRSFPRDLPAAVLVTQHMPASFTTSLAHRLDHISQLEVREARGGENIAEGMAFVAPGGYHLVVDKQGRITLSSAPPIQYVRPSADVMMESLAEAFGPQVIGIILTGMGRDGADGMSHIKQKGGCTIVQEPASAVIPSMPQAVIKGGWADLVVPLEQIGEAILYLLFGTEI